MDKEVGVELRKRFRASEWERLMGGFTNDVYLLKGTKPLLVAKVAQWSSQDMENEVKVLKFLETTSYTPKVIDLFSINNKQIIVFTYAEGMNGQAILDTGDHKRSINLFRGMGVRLADIHSHSYSGNPSGLRFADFEMLLYDLSFVPKELVKKSERLLQHLDRNKREWTLTHGDFGSHNILTDEECLTVIDWEWAEWGHPLIDLAWTCWNTKLHYTAIADELNQIFLNAYKAQREVVYSPELIKTYSLYKLWMILYRVQHADEETQQKWINRLEWTFENEII